MLVLADIKANPQHIIERLKVKGFDGREAIEKILALDEERRSLQKANDAVASELKKLASGIGAMMKEGRREEAEAAKQRVAALKADTAGRVDRQAEAEKEIRDILLTIPNTPCADVPEGLTAADNVVVKEGGVIPDLGADALPHWELAKKYGIIDFELGVKVTGAGFPFYIGKGARLQRALIQYFLNSASEAGYTEVEPPFVVNEASGYGTGQLPDKEGQMYHVNLDNLYLIPTAEVPVTNIYRDVILAEDSLPRKTALTRPAGAARPAPTARMCAA